ncbi:BTB/POZ domain-containing protein 6 [Aphelenchoides avenae]|nr:BTB/POZ domain-containing protein 6 [Aphelenchus avenae]
MKPVPTLKERMLHILSDASTADVTFNVGDEQVRIPAHSQVLAGASDTFKAMFYGEFNCEKEVEVPDASPDGFRALLRYVYTDEADITEDILESVLCLSDKYLLHGLFAECVEWAKKNMKASNVCRFLPVAELFSELGELCWHTVLDNGDDALNSDAFLSLPKELLAKVIGSDNLVAEEKTVYLRTVMWAERQLEV